MHKDIDDLLPCTERRYISPSFFALKKEHLISDHHLFSLQSDILHLANPT